MKKMPATQVAGIFVMGFVRGESRDQGSLFPVSLDELVPDDHVCRVIDAFVGSLDLVRLGFRRAEPAATAFLLALGPNAVPEALHLYLHHNEQQREEWLAVLIERYPQHLLKEAIKRIQLYAGARTVELLMIFEKLGDPACSPCVRPFLQHPDEAARFQALTLLLRFNDEQGVKCLRKLLDSRKNQDFLAALDLAEKYSVARVAADLAKRLKTRFLLYRSDVICNERILLALENFGYRVAVSDLERLNRIRFSFYPQQLARMKSVVSAMLLKRTPVPKSDRARGTTVRHDANAQ